MSLLRAEMLSKNFGGVVAIDSLDFALNAGRVHSIIGPNGAGKTTLFNLITGVYRPSAGRIWLGGQDITHISTHQLANLGISRTFQNLQIFHNMTAIENVMVGRHRHADTRIIPTLLGLPAISRSNRTCRAVAEELLEFVGLSDVADRPASSLAYGVLKRLELARALATDPVLLLLDEPAAGCNAAETADIDRLIVQIASRGVTVVLVEHDMKLVMAVSDHVLVLDHGQKLAEGTPREVVENSDVIAAYLGSELVGARNAA